MKFVDSQLPPSAIPKLFPICKITDKVGIKIAQLLKACHELLKNAYDAIIDKRLENYNQNFTGKIITEYFIDGNDVVFRIIDNGKPIEFDELKQPKIRPKDDRYFGKQGQGIKVVKGIVEMIGGTVIWTSLNDGTSIEMRIPKSILNDTSSLSEYLQTENYFYPLLTQEMQDRVAKRIVDLERVVIETPDRTRRSIADFVKHILAQYGIEDKLEHIIVFGSYIFSSKPSDIDFTIGLKGNFNQPELLDILNKINRSELTKEGAFKIIFPQGKDYAVSEAHFTFVGEGSHSYDRQDHLALLHTLSGAVIYGEKICQSHVEPSAFTKRAVEEAKSLSKRILEKRTVAHLDSKKAVYRLLHAVLIVSRINPTLLETINPENVYEFIKRYFSEDIDQHQRAIQALQDLHGYLTPEKANSVYAYFLIPEVATLTENGDEKSQIEAVNMLCDLTSLGNLEAFKFLGLFSKIKNPQVMRSIMIHPLFRHGINSALKSGQEFKAPEIIELNRALETLTLQIDKNTVKNHTNYIGRHKTLFKDTLGENKPDTLVRVPIEAIESVGIDNIKGFLETFQEASNGYVELYYMSVIGEVSENVYQKYGLQKKPLPKDFRRMRENTVTLFPALKGEEINQSAIVSRLGNINVTPENTILSPIGLQHDPVGLIRATILGLKMMDIARQIKEKGSDIVKDQAFKDKIQLEMLEQLKNVCDVEDLKNFNLTPDDIIALAAGNINNIITALKKLIKLLPITPVNAEELRQIYEHAKEVITAA